eukprot:TRINITY_DN30323_c0_g1_i1.p1 TRINITY_DN30323_c0_g1~~TRINITY_DN30323_c0_g1_i1.p1  ORF type:complete len:264 (+),score=103.27 TRINITY_DN30323_c0_g1_i1:61-852(+)
MGYFRTHVADGILTATMCAQEGAEEWGTLRLEHRLCPGFVAELSAVLDAVEADRSIEGFVLGGDGRFWSNGLDLNFIEKQHPDDALAFQQAVEKLFARILVFPVPTVALLNGHTVAAGAMLALCFDARVMNSQKGWFMVPGVNIGLTYTYGMIELMKTKIPTSMRNPMIVHSMRYGPQELLRLNVVAELHPLSTLDFYGQQFAKSLAQPQGRRKYKALRETMGAIKMNLYRKAYVLLDKGGEEMGFTDRHWKVVTGTPPPSKL